MMPRLALLLLHLTLATCSSSGHEDPLNVAEDTSGWVDPHDMGIQGRLKQVGHKMGSGVKVGSSVQDIPSKTQPPTVGSMMHKIKECTNCADIQRKLNGCQKRLDAYKEDGSCPELPLAESETPCTEKLFFQRYARFLLNKLSTDPGERIIAEIEMTQEDVTRLKRFASDQSVHLPDVDHTLSHLFKNVRTIRDGDYDHAEPSLDNTGGYYPAVFDLFWLGLFATIFSLTWLLWSGLPLWKFTVLILLLSSAWHWSHMYKKALSKKHVALVASSKIPPECFPDELSWYRTLWNSRSAEAKCAEYHEALLVDPLWEVSPTMAISETISKFVLQPLEHFGDSLGKFFSSLTRNLTWTDYMTVLPFVFGALNLCLIMIFGYRVRLPCFLGSLEPHHRPVEPRSQQLQSPERLKELQAEVKKLTKILAAQQHEREADAPKDKLQHIQGSDSPTRPDSKTILSDPRVEEVAAKREDFTRKQTPVKSLVARGSLTSPGETEFEWVETARKTLSFDDDGKVPTKKCGSENPSENDFMKKVETLFSDDMEETADDEEKKDEKKKPSSDESKK